MLALAFPDRVARNRGNGSFVLANGRGAAVDQTSALARAPYIAVAELTGTAASGRILLARRLRSPTSNCASPIRSRSRTRSVRSRRDGAAGAAQANPARDHAVGGADGAVAFSETARVLADGLVASGLDKLPWSKPLQKWRDR
jgi:ATP-dependent helicase HrpB